MWDPYQPNSRLFVMSADGVLLAHPTERLAVRPGRRDRGNLLTALNDQLGPDMDGRSFITMLLWMVDPDRRHVRWANAGHDPAILYDPHTDTFDEVGYDGIPLGIDSTVQFSEQTFGPLRPGHVVVLGTDGIRDTVDPAGDFYGKDRLRDLVRARATDSAEQIATAVRQDLDAFRARGHQRDDVTLVVIKVLGDDSEMPTPPRRQLIEDPALPLS